MSSISSKCYGLKDFDKDIGWNILPFHASINSEGLRLMSNG